jgi:hypothetical protein
MPGRPLRSSTRTTRPMATTSCFALGQVEGDFDRGADGQQQVAVDEGPGRADLVDLEGQCALFASGVADPGIGPKNAPR